VPKQETFADRLKKVLKEKGIHTESELVRLVQIARERSPTFSIQRLIALRRGFRPEPEEVPALAVALGVHPREFITDQEALDESNSQIAKGFASKMDRPDLAEEFNRFVFKGATFRKRSLDSDELFRLYHEFLAERHPDEC
jgi:transcriptional regulator with XRE-family HTH domain